MDNDFIVIGLLCAIFLVVVGGLFFVQPVIQADIVETNVTTSVSGDFYFDVASGKVEGHSSINKFGHNPLATSGDDVWSGGGAYAFYPTSALTMEAYSTDVNDAVGGTGARTLIVYGLNDTWDEVSEVINLTGTTPVNLQNTYKRMFRAIVLTAGSSETNEGNIIVEDSVGGIVGIYIGELDGQTQHAIYTVPRGKEAYFVKGYVGIADDDKFGEVAEFQWQSRPNNGITGAWQVKGEMGLNSVGSSNWQYAYGVPAGILPEKTDIRIRTVLTTAPVGVVAGFDLILVDT